VGSSAQTKAIKGVAGSIKLELAQFRELEAFMQFAQDLDKATADRIGSGQRMVELLKQRNGNPMPVEQQVAVLFAAQNKLFATVPVSKVRAAEEQLLSFLDANASDALTEIKKTALLSDDTKKKLNDTFEAFRSAHTELFA
jgi:F-type H+-transporting ATPase subunit alpha